MSLTNPNLVYTIICKKITDRQMPPASAALFLDDFFKGKDKERILKQYMGKPAKSMEKKHNEEVKKRSEMVRVILIDELDALMTKK